MTEGQEWPMILTDARADPRCYRHSHCVLFLGYHYRSVFTYTLNYIYVKVRCKRCETLVIAFQSFHRVILRRDNVIPQLHSSIFNDVSMSRVISVSILNLKATE